ncbi:MAG: hypothetical protein VKP57_04940 [Candidatus Sericytochromatia bacterium]|nr:hypothetical protein [Candidatus Sericytochromatia bacterium]
MARWSFRGLEGQGICGPDGESLAQVRDVLWDPLEQRVLAFRVTWIDPEARSHGPSEDIPLAQVRRAASSALECQGLPETTAGLDTGTVADALMQGTEVLGVWLTDTRQGKEGVVADVHFSDDSGAILAYELEDGTMWPPLDDFQQTAPQRWSGKVLDGIVRPVHGDSGPDRPRVDLPVARGEEPGAEDMSETFGAWGDPLQEPPAPRVE